MDNLTHGLIGALLGQMGLKRKTGLAMPTLVIAANIPDIDAGCTLLGTVSLAMRRGITHGPIAMLLLPLALTGIMVWYDRRQTRRGTRPESRAPVRPGWLLALAYIGCLSHPLFDWFNSYGIRLLEPFSHRWFYGDALFIIDPWLLAMLGAGLWLSRKRDRAGRADWRRPAWTGLGGAVGYIALNFGISAAAADVVRMEEPYPKTVVANPVPLAFWRRDVLWRDDNRYGHVQVSLLDWAEKRSASSPIGMDDPRIAARVPRSRAAQAFLFWSRLPVASAKGDIVILGDQRLQNNAIRGFSAELPPE